MANLIYHGTTATVARLALTEGLRPRELTGVAGNWEHTVQSHPSLVYLTSAYAPYFAIQAAGDEGLLGIVEVDTDRLAVENLRPDEDFLAEVAQGFPDPWIENHPSFPSEDDSRVLAAWFRERIENYGDHWSISVDRLGSCAHAGVVPPEAITRISTVDAKHVGHAARRAFDPSICMMNYLLLGETYRALTRWFMGEPTPMEDLLPLPPPAGFPRADIEHLARRFGDEQRHLRVVAACPRGTAR